MHKFKYFLVHLICFFSLANAADRPFVVGNLIGQLGNQLFVIAATVSLALDHDATPIFPDLIVKQSDNTPLNYQKMFSHLNVSLPQAAQIQCNYNEPYFHYHPIPYIPNMTLAGYFQSEKYFRHHKREILQLFAPNPEIEQYLKNKYSNLLNHPNTVAVHMRSYANEDPEQKYFPKCARNYFENAMNLFSEDTLFLVFSNRMDLCKKEFENINRNIYFVEGEAHYHDFYLMSMCDHNIISNSSFSWWAAYLNPNPDKVVIAPSYWFTDWCTANTCFNSKDIIPDEWIILNSR